ncbi:hypothetical protein EHI8A_189940 [Entamoeba histolytica HM-1:IMSS-B]|uniref:Uncharacterized protein n=6 Tax=Entamoeba TaxID=5758 RepID=C4M204_ENTH1|nr:hypothetical protein ENU1_209680 [Entamoeba nuttalli P19]XP_649766.1 hypothetical protein EHI_165250 [Entamoeba histolytica HM-1:IMSS]EMH76253.1 hypothetical protein EHI8A_189940 [Entamoeba histolytica HM-1:IMSS-B]ENY61599.1 hypothetical protein EHI7A_164440 [Entamoeba histolytica HM-1:IMSS-A]EAL44380.1 hypothetical protein EHI_165250 [Entamoeba histolytica HM-1:IMSS]EKE37095.1 hypothetical protein ENU1_209680 [Entamoeba nuttalli P19]|eukprot:XP_008860573.1 hypothetical protein ENU1_209680 [Entamoeba nuttalli P19]
MKKVKVDLKSFEVGECSMLLSLLGEEENKNTFASNIPPEQNNEKKYSASDKRKDIADINRRYTFRLKALNVALNTTFREWKDLESRGFDTKEVQSRWSILNEEYRISKRRASLEIYELVQPLYRKAYGNDGVHDLHGQGIKSGSLVFIVSTILDNEKNFIDPKNKNIVFDIGDENDGEWHMQAVCAITVWLKERNYNFWMNETKRFVFVKIN